MKALFKPLLAALTAAFALGASAQGTIKIGEINSYKAQPAFLEPYKKGMDLAVEEINAGGGVPVFARSQPSIGGRPSGQSFAAAAKRRAVGAPSLCQAPCFNACSRLRTWPMCPPRRW